MAAPRSLARHLITQLSLVYGIALFLTIASFVYHAWNDAELVPVDSGAWFEEDRDLPRSRGDGGRRRYHDRLDWLRQEIGDEVLPILLPLFAATLVVAPLAIRRGLRPLQALSAQALRITPRESGGRLDEVRAPVEIRPLVAAVNQALARMDEGFRQQRRFTADVAHQLRMPLAILAAQIDELEAGAGEGPALRAGVARMAHLVDQLLTVARLESGQIRLDQVFDLAAAARRTLAEIAPVAIAAGKHVALVVEAEVSRVRGNAVALEDAIRNLVDNGLRHSPPGGVVEVVVAPGVCLEVRDRGPGIPEALRGRIFEPFWKGGEARDRGTGLGLAIVRETVVLHGGRIAVGDRDGGGAVFRILLPPADRELPI